MANQPALVDEKEQQIKESEQFVNSLSAMTEALNGYPYGGAVLSQSDTLFLNNRWYLVSNLRQLLSQLYVEHGIVQTLVDQPVDDAFRAGFVIRSGQLSGDDIERLETWLETEQVIDSYMQAIKWSRLYGGGGVMIITDQNHMKPFNIRLIDEKSPLEFRSCDMWELYYDSVNATGTYDVGGALGAEKGDFYSYYGVKIHESYVLRCVGKEAPSFIKPRLRGWGMSELERLVRSLNQYLKNQDVIFELLDEAKIDVMRIKGFNAALLNDAGTNGITARIQMANQTKNYQHALVMDSDDEYVQKQITFSGLAEVLTQIRQGIAADLKMPITKLFGISSSGFNSGEDDIENYNSMVEGEIRRKNKPGLIRIIGVACQKLFGFVPDDLTINWNPLRILNAKEEEEVKDSQFNRVTTAFQLGLADDAEAKQAINKDSLLGVEVNDKTPATPPATAQGIELNPPSSARGNAGKQAPQQA